VTGVLAARIKAPQATPVAAGPTGPGPFRARGDLLDRLQRQLYLSPIQREHIEKILRENHDRMKQLWDSIAPQAQEEHRRVRELIRKELTPEQVTRFDEIMKPRGTSRPGDSRRREEWREKSGRRPDRSSSAAGTNEPLRQTERR
jgi:hypothetical protein